jgi:hypothetical protein
MPIIKLSIEALADNLKRDGRSNRCNNAIRLDGGALALQFLRHDHHCVTPI